MTRIALCLPPAAAERISAEAVRHGHDIVARVGGADELATRIDVVHPDVALVAATERHLTAQLVGICDEAGTRVLALVSSEPERRYALSLGLLESVDPAAPWPEIETELSVTPARGPAAQAFISPFSPEARATAIGNAPARAEQDATDETPLGAAPQSMSQARPKSVSQTQPEQQSGTTRGIVIAVWGPAGAPGRTTVAINIAAELAATGASVVLADVDTYSGSIAPALGILDEAPGFAAACRLAGANSLTRSELERISQRYGSGRSSFRVLTGIGRPSRWPELSAARVVTTIDECRAWVDFTVIDSGFSLEHDEEISSDLFAPRRNAASITALRAADRVVAVGSADPVGLSRFLRAHVDLVETVPRERVIVAMNKIRASAIGLNPIGQVAQTLSRFGGIQSAAMIPFDGAALDAAILSGRTLADAAPKSAARAAIRDLVVSRLVPGSPARRARALRTVSG